MSQHGWRLERTYLAGAGLNESRLEGLDIAWSDPLEPSGHSALWADNGTGKTMITALRYALYLPHSRDFIRGDSDRSLAKLVRSEDVCHIVEQATRIVNGDLQRIVVGMVASWADGGTQDVDNPSKLTRTFYGWVTAPDGPTIDTLPLRTTTGRWSTHKQFIGAVREVLPHGGAAAPFAPSDHQRHWQDWLMSAGVDLDQVRFQTVMNASEGGVDRVMRFTNSDAFVRWLIGATMPTSTVDQITKSIDTLRANAAARPRWEDELTLWKHVIDPLLNLAIANESLAEDRAKVATAHVDAAAVVADADATITALITTKQTETERHQHHDRRRRDAQSMLRRAQAHRLRMQLRATELRVVEAEGIAEARQDELDEAVQHLNAWRLVNQVLVAKRAKSTIAGLVERITAAEKESTQLHHDETQYRHALARLLTFRRDVAVRELASANTVLRDAEKALNAVSTELESCVSDRATAAEQVRILRSRIGDAERTISMAVAAGLLPEGSDPAQVDTGLQVKFDSAHADRDRADAGMKDIEDRTRAQRAMLHTAQRQASNARDDIRSTTQELRLVEGRLDALTNDESLLDILSGTTLDPWGQRTHVTDRLNRRATKADSEASDARAAMTTAQRVVDSVGEDGLLPPSVLAEDCARRCHAAEVPAWPGWRWLADTMTPAAAEAFASARPDIASGLVVAHPDLVDRAVRAIGELDLDVALWVGAVIDPEAAVIDDDHGTSTYAKILLPPPGIFDRDAASDIVDGARKSFTEAERNMRAAERRGQSARETFATLQQLWADYPEDPRNRLAEKVNGAEVRRLEAEHAEQTAAQELAKLDHDQDNHQRDRDTAQRTIDATSRTRLQLAPVVSAAADLATARTKLPARRQAVTSLDDHMGKLRRNMPGLKSGVSKAEDQVRGFQRSRDDAAEALRVAGLSATTDGPVPLDDCRTIEARLESVQAAIAEAAVDPNLHSTLETTRQRLSDADSRLDADPELRAVAEQLAESDGARHPVALETSIRAAEQRERSARGEAAKADSIADAARSEHRQRSSDTTDRSSPDVEGFVSAAGIAGPAEAERVARELDVLTGELLETQRTEGNLAEQAKAAASEAEHASEVLAASARPLRHLTDRDLAGRCADTIQELNQRIETVAERVRNIEQRMRDSEDEQRRLSDKVRNYANSRQARKVEDHNDPRVVDLILRLRGDEQLPAEAERIAGHLEQRATSLADDLTHHDEDVRTSATMLHVQASRAMQRLRSYQNQSRLPEGLGDWSNRRFVDIDHEPVPADESVAVDRVARVVHAQLAPGAGRSDAETMLFAAARALVDAPFRVRLLKPHIDLALQRVDVAELKNFSGGQRVTAGVLLYATMTRVRAAGDDATSIGWLWLDNPFGQASADQFVRTMRLAADRLGLQLVFTAAPKDKGALSMFDRVITLNRRSRPSSGEKVIVIDDGHREIVDLALVQKDVMAVLGE